MSWMPGGLNPNSIVSAQAIVPTCSTFRRATRYKGSEDRLTEILAAVLERVPEVGPLLARAWTAPSQESAAAREIAVSNTSLAHSALATLPLRSVRTQHTTGKGKRPDLVLRFGPRRQPTREDVVIWVEDKLDANPHEMQLTNYCKELPQDVHAAAVVLLAPRSSLPYTVPEPVPESVFQRSWQEAGRQILKLCDNEADPVKLFLLRELIAYMREENLTDLEAIRPEHLVSLAYASQADAALERICEEASGLIEKGWDRAPDDFESRPRLKTKTPAYGWDYWESWKMTKTRKGEEDYPCLDWHAAWNSQLAEAEGRSLVFISGLTTSADGELAATDEERVRHERLEAGVLVGGIPVRFQRVSDDDWKRLARIAFPEEILIGRTLEAQAAMLAEWVIAGFRALAMPLDELRLQETSG